MGGVERPSYRVGIVGTRFKANDIKRLKIKEILLDAMESIVVERPTVKFISGGALGVDRLAEEIAKELGRPIKVIEPDYKKYGRYDAPKVRNIQIVDESDKIIAIWDGMSGGTAHSIAYATAIGVPVQVKLVEV